MSVDVQGQVGPPQYGPQVKKTCLKFIANIGIKICASVQNACPTRIRGRHEVIGFVLHGQNVYIYAAVGVLPQLRTAVEQDVVKKQTGCD